MTRRTVIVGIGGASSSGKTTLAKLIASITKDSILIHQDDFYKKDEEIPIDKETGYENWDVPEAINFNSFKKELTHIKETGKLSPGFESFENRYDSDTKDQDFKGIDAKEISKSSIEFNKLLHDLNIRLVIVDGFMLFHDADIIKLFDFKIFLTASYETLKLRRAKRAGYQTQVTFWVDPPDFFDKIVYPAYSQTHAHLFQDANVENQVDDDRIRKYGITTFENNDGTSLQDILDKSLKSLKEYIQTQVEN